MNTATASQEPAPIYCVAHPDGVSVLLLSADDFASFQRERERQAERERERRRRRRCDHA